MDNEPYQVDYSNAAWADMARANMRGMPPYQQPQQQRMSQYEQLGSMFTGMSRVSDQSLNLGDGNLTEGYNKDWLSQVLAAGSANGAKIGGMMSGGGGGGGGKGGGGGGMQMSGPQGGWEDSSGMGGFGEGATAYA